jgi:hypothetical protein
MDAGDWGHAEAHLRRAAEVAPKNANTHEQLGVVLAIQKKYAAAGEAFGRATALTPDWPHGHRANRDFFNELAALQKAGRPTDRIRLPMSGLTIPLAHGEQEFLVMAMRYTGSEVIDVIQRVKPASPPLVFWLELDPIWRRAGERCSTVRDLTAIPAGRPFVAGGWDQNVFRYPALNAPFFCHDVPAGAVILRLAAPRELTMTPAEVRPLLVALSAAIRQKYGIR